MSNSPILYIKSGTRYRPASASEVCENASGVLIANAVRARVALASPTAAKDFIKMQAGLDFEQFGVIYLDTRHKVLDVQILSRGTINGASVHPREVVKNALLKGAQACIVFHNHPSGDPNPSHADELITKRLKEALALVDIGLLDHLIVAGDRVRSLAELGLV